MDIENEICQPLQILSLMTAHRVQGASFSRQRFGRRRSAASDRVGLNSSAKSDARRCTGGLRASPPGRYSTMPWFVACKAQSRQHRGEQHREEHDQDGCRAQIMKAPEMLGGVCDFSTLMQQ
jgi:hypothetical protein